MLSVQTTPPNESLLYFIYFFKVYMDFLETLYETFLYLRLFSKIYEKDDSIVPTSGKISWGQFRHFLEPYRSDKSKDICFTLQSVYSYSKS